MRQMTARTSRRMSAGGIPAVVGLLLLTSCSSSTDPEASSGPPPVASAGDYPATLTMDRVPTDGASWWGSEVANPGTVVISDDGCLALQLEGLGQTVGLLLPPTTALQGSGEDLTVVVSDVLTFGPGSRLSGSALATRGEVDPYLTGVECRSFEHYMGPGELLSHP